MTYLPAGWQETGRTSSTSQWSSDRATPASGAYDWEMERKHAYDLVVTWTGNTGTGTSGYRNYQRQYEITAAGKTPISGSSDPAFRGDRDRWNPEELLVAALAACHKLSYLHLCADAGIIVTAYTDHAHGVMELDAEGSGRFVEVTLKPIVTVASGTDEAKALALHESAHSNCFIANSVNFLVLCEPVVGVQQEISTK